MYQITFLWFSFALQNDLTIYMYFQSEQKFIKMFWCNFHTSLSFLIDSYIWISTISVLEGHSFPPNLKIHKEKKNSLFMIQTDTILVPTLDNFAVLKKEALKHLTVKAKYPSLLWVSVINRNVQQKKIWLFKRKNSVAKLAKDAFWFLNSLL